MVSRAAAAHLAVDVRMLEHSGIGTYVRALVPRVRALRPDWRFTLLGPHGAAERLALANDAGVRVVECRSDVYSVGEQWEMSRRVPRDATALWVPHYNVPVLARVPLVVTVHDVYHVTAPPIISGLAKRSYARAMFGVVRRRARRIIVVSDFTRGEFTRLIGYPRGGPPVVIPNGVDEAWFAARGNAVDGDAERMASTRPYLVAVGNVTPTKNLARLVTAFARVRGAIPHDLVIVGRREGMRTPDGAVEAEAATLGDRVRFTGHVDEATLRRIVASASALVFPSLYEGFGLPPLEAMAAGVPVVASRAAALPEVCGDAAEYCDPYDENDIARALIAITGDAPLRQRLVAAGRVRASAYTWKRAALATADVLTEAAT